VNDKGIIIAFEDELQRVIYKLNLTVLVYNREILKRERKFLKLHLREKLIKSEIVIQNQLIEYIILTILNT